MGKLKLEVNAEKTRICKMPDGTFDFLGYTFGRAYSPKTGQARLGYWPSKKSIRRMVEKIHAMTERSKSMARNHRAGGEVEQRLRGLGELLCGRHIQKAYRALDTYAALRLRRWLRCKHKVRCLVPHCGWNRSN